MAHLFKKIIKNTSFLLILILSTSSVFAQKSKKKTTKSTATKSKIKTTTSTKTTTKVEKKSLETKLSEEEQKKQDISIGKKLAAAMKSDALKAHSASGIGLQRFISNEEGKMGADVFDIKEDANLELTSIETILGTYIAETFEYSQDDAETLASFVIGLNSKNRNNQDYVIKNYSTNVVLGTKKEKIGLPAVTTAESIDGKSQVLIPTEKNILKKYALDVAALELLDQTKADLVLNDGDAKKAKIETLLNKKASAENEELNNRMMEASPAEIKAITDRLALNKKRAEMRKANITSEKEYTSMLDSKTKKDSATTPAEIVKSDATSTTVNSALPSGPVVPKDKFTTFISGGNHAGINAREFIFIPGSGILAIGYDAAKVEKKDLQLFMTSTGDYELKRSSEGIKLASESPLIYSNGKIYVIEMLKNDAFLAQFNSELEFELRSEATINEKSIIEVVGDEVIVTAIEKKGNSNDKRVFKVKDLSLAK